LGRKEFPGPEISRKHLDVRRLGPCLEVTSIGRNGTQLWRDGQWVPFQAGKAFLLMPGDVIRLGGLDLRLAA
jgi:hypothetical protein